MMCSVENAFLTSRLFCCHTAARTAKDDSFFLADDMIFSNVWLPADYAILLGILLFVLFFILAFRSAKHRKAEKLAKIAEGEV